jgi:hypothetical protein
MTSNWQPWILPDPLPWVANDFGLPLYLKDRRRRMKTLLKNLLYKFPSVRDLKLIREDIHELRAELRTLAAWAFQQSMESNPRYADPKRLLKSAAQVCSQNGEDGIIQEIFRRIQTTDRVFVEIGVGDGTENNTAFLLSLGWQGFWIDGNDAFLRNIEKRQDLQGGCIKGLASFITRENVVELFSKLAVPAEFDLLSLDVDQNTFYVWDALEKYRPRVVVIEYNATIPPDIDWKVNYAADRVWDGTHNFGASLKAFEVLGRRLGYALVGCDYLGANAFFVRNDLVADHFAAPYSAENHYESARYSLLHRRAHPASILDRAGDR